MTAEETLQRAGLSKIEAKVYLELCRSGTSTAYKIAKDAGLFKANTYEALKKLEGKKLVSEIKIGSKSYYESRNPDVLIENVDRFKRELGELVPSIKEMQKNPAGSEVNLTKGVESFIEILWGFLDYSEPIFVYGASRDAYEALRHKIEKFHKKRIGKGIKMYHIYNKANTSDRLSELKKMSHTYARSLPAEFDSVITTVICGNKVVIVAWDTPVKIIEIRDKDIAKTYKNYYKLLWRSAKGN